MPIRINLLAEAQAAAELRRKDPVKRGIWVGSFLVLVVVLWIAKLQLDIMFEKSNYNNIESNWKGMTAKYSTVTNAQAQTRDIDHKLDALDLLSTNRFLWGPVFDALQKTVVDHVQVLKITGSQSLTKEDPHDVVVNGIKAHLPGAMVERANLTIECKDLKPSDQDYDKFKERLGTFDFFVKRLQRKDGFVLDGILGPLTVDPLDPSRQFQTFTLASHFPELRHND